MKSPSPPAHPRPHPRTQAAGKPGSVALDPFTGKIVWNTPAPAAACHYAGDRSKDYTKGACVRAQSAAPAVMPGIVFSGTLDGWFRAYDAASGKIVWEFSTTAQTYDTVNGNHGTARRRHRRHGTDDRRRHGVHDVRVQWRGPYRQQWDQRSIGVFGRRKISRTAASRYSRQTTSLAECVRQLMGITKERAVRRRYLFQVVRNDDRH